MKSTTTKAVKNGIQKKEKGNTETSGFSENEGLHDLFVDELKDIYWAEKALVKALPKMIKNATSQELIDGLAAHLEETKGQVLRLEDVFSSIDVKASAKKCEAMAGLIKEAEEIMQETEPGSIRDEGIISAGQKVEHYEIATYGTLRAFAKKLGKNKAASLLEETLNEEKGADEKLTQIAESLYAEYAEENEYEDSDTMVAPKTKRK